MAADTYYFLLSPSVCLICTSSLRWPAAIFSAECFLSVMAEDKRGLKIRSISMDFRFESPGECWALWKDSERATKGKTPKKKKSQFLMIFGPKVLFFRTHKQSLLSKQTLSYVFCGVIYVCKLWHKVKVSFSFLTYCTLNTQSHHWTRNWTTPQIPFFNL